MVYAQINDENICIGISHLTGEIEAHNLIKINNYDTSLLGKKWEAGQWVEVPLADTQLQPLSEVEKTNLAIMEALAENYEQNIKQEEQNIAILAGMAELYEAVAVKSEGV